MDANALKWFVRTIADFRGAGVELRDISTLLADGRGFPVAIRGMPRD